MKHTKIYFSDVEEDYAHSIEYILEEMKELNLTEIEVSLAERELKSNYFYCKEIGEAMDKSFNDCGKQCEDYTPRNGKSGCCKHRGYVYMPGKEFILSIDGKLKEKVIDPLIILREDVYSNEETNEMVGKMIRKQYLV